MTKELSITSNGGRYAFSKFTEGDFQDQIQGAVDRDSALAKIGDAVALEIHFDELQDWLQKTENGNVKKVRATHTKGLREAS
ncbi:MAG: hypothetical protein NPINA01_20930 [Nitrospinaceae bacterium]|nr:MAG: hypothetical protein NPINA01_20930 [Nitrospinaceae bacterium]